MIMTFVLASQFWVYLPSGEWKIFANRMFNHAQCCLSEEPIVSYLCLQLFCWTDKWHGMTMADIRALEEETKKRLDEERARGEIKGTAALEK